MDALYVPAKPALIIPKPAQLVRSDDLRLKVVPPFLAGLLLNPYAQAAAFSPADIGSMVAWYRSDQGITQSGGTVSQWNDLSGNARHVVQASSPNQPAYGATSGANSLPGITFASASSTKLAVTFTGIAQPLHLFTIVKFNAYNANGGIVTGSAIGERIFCVGDVTGTQPDIYMGGSGLAFNTSDTTNFALFENLANTSSSSIIRGSGTPVTGTIGSGSLSGVTMGQLIGSAYGSFILSEVLLYSAAITSTNLTNLRAYFAARYAVATQ